MSSIARSATEDRQAIREVSYVLHLHTPFPLQSQSTLYRFDGGFEIALGKAQQRHNKGDVPHTAKFRPWKVEEYFAFETKETAAAFEQYLKSGSGHSFAKRHF